MPKVEELIVKPVLFRTLDATLSPPASLEIMPAKTVLITGSNRGLGLEFVSQYLSQGWKVIGAVRDLSTADAVRPPSPNIHISVSLAF